MASTQVPTVGMRAGSRGPPYSAMNCPLTSLVREKSPRPNSDGATKLHALQKKHPLLKEDKDSYVASQAAIHEVKRQIIPPSRPSTGMSGSSKSVGFGGL